MPIYFGLVIKPSVVWFPITVEPTVCGPVGTGCVGPTDPGVDFWAYPNWSFSGTGYDGVGYVEAAGTELPI